MKSILISTPGRSGSHWISFILRYLLDLQITQTETADNLDLTLPDRVFISHDLLSRFDYEPIIVAVRHPADVAVSAAHYLAWKNAPEDRAVMQRFWGTVPEGKLEIQLAHAATHGHHPGWWADYMTATTPHHLVRFEDLRRDTPGTIQQILRALGLKVGIRRIRREVARQKAFAQEHGLGRGQSGTFYRRGEVGEWREHFSEEQRRAFARKYGDVMSRLGYEMNNV